MTVESDAYGLVTVLSCMLSCLALGATLVMHWRPWISLAVLLMATAAVAAASTATLQIRDWWMLAPAGLSVGCLLFGWEGWLAVRSGREPWFHAWPARRALRRRGINPEVTLAEIRDRYALHVLDAAGRSRYLSEQLDEIAAEADRVLHDRWVREFGYVPAWSLLDAAQLHVSSIEAAKPGAAATDEIMLAALCRVAQRRGLL